MLIRPTRYVDPDVVALDRAVQAEYARRYNSETGDASAIAVEQFDPPAGLFLLGRSDDAPVAMGGWRLIETAHQLDATRPAEIKRMYVVPERRGAGLSRLMLAELEATAAAAGVDLLVLETGLAQPEAINLYRSAGYTEVDPTGWSYYACYAEAVHLGLRLPRPG